jgi:holo-[acyl-carrier protein] synthase
MILSIGIDITEVYRMRETIARTPRFAERVFTDAEREYCESKGVVAAQSYAARFAAKEAFLKALKTGKRGKITWHDMEVLNDADGVPSLTVKGEAASWKEWAGPAFIFRSLTPQSTLSRT